MIDSGSPEFSPKARKSRLAFLSSAEKIFARNGYTGTRLEDVAEAAGLKRSTLLYHFSDKQALYDAMLEAAFGPLTAQLDEALSSPGSITQRIEKAVDAWVDAIAVRPTIARLILRYVADVDEQPVQSIYTASKHMAGRYWELFEEGRASGELKPRHKTPFHTASAIVGHTVFYVSALSALIPTDNFNAFDPEDLISHKEDLRQNVRYLLGIEAAAPTSPSFN